MIAFLPHQAWISTDAIVRAWYRSHISHRHMLEWQTAHAAEAQAEHHNSTTQNQMLLVSAASLFLTLVLLVKGAFAPSAGFLVLWAFSPLVLKWLSNPPRVPASQQISARQITYLRGQARRTWRYFDDLVGPEQLAAARQYATRAARRGRPPHFTDQYRHVAHRCPSGSRFRLSHFR